MAPTPVSIWPAVAPLLIPAIEQGGEATFNEVAEEIDAGLAHLWIAHEGEDVRMALVTQHASDGSFHLWLCGGREMSTWLRFLPVVKAAARDAGCDRLTIDGRRGWGRVLGWAKAPDGCWECRL